MGLLRYFLIVLLFIFPIAEIGSLQIGALSININDVFVFIFASVWLLFNNRNLKKNRGFLTKPILIFATICLLSLLLNLFNLNTQNFLISFLYLLRWVSYAVIYLALINENKKFINTYKYLLLIPISAILFLGYVQYSFYQNLRNLFYLGWDEHLYRLFSSFLDPNFAGIFFVISFIYLLYLSYEMYLKKNKLRLSGLIFLSIASFIAIFLTYSRSALISLIVSFIVLLILINKKKLIIFFVAAILIFVIISPNAFKTEGTNLFRTASSQARLDSTGSAVKVIKSSPFFGVGFNAYRYAKYRLNIATDEKWEITRSGAGTDNSFLFVLATTGVMGFIAYLYLLYRMFLLGKTSIKKQKFAIVFISCLIGAIINSFFINSLFYVYIMEFIWIFAAVTENS